MKPTLALAALLLVSVGAMAQDASRPLNLKLPPDYVPASSATAAAPAHAGTTAGAPRGSGESVAVTPSRPKDPPGTYYGDTSGRMADTAIADDEPRCDDATYNKPQVHGSVSTGVMSGSHGRSGDFQSGVVNLSQAFGSCDHPTGGVSISVGGGTGHFNPGHR
ncbi:hypothetical protein L2Y94_03670 [Luteibacter aegosomatis]|uniref:hypothetical protein n=1 Tax=Luteibacter aegosomatis TaxID=2911537 RepID=UPI001FF89668|nr:hypothetical protein [Luteibacter aegosomatis]UPG86471.1 hypothetical protein L2Y94_03670 [Luteibacter aegosomatis]